MQTKIIKQKMKSVGSIKKITKTMEMVSVAKMRKTVSRALAARPYFQAALELLNHLAKENLKHPLFKMGRGDRHLVLVIASNKGLCGAYNLNIMKALAKLKEKFGGTIDCLTVGRQAERAAARLSLPILASFVELTDQVSIGEIEGLKKIILDEFQAGRYKSVTAVYTEFIRASKFKPTAREILPINPAALKDLLAEVEIEPAKSEEKRNLSLYLFEPGEETILDLIVPALLHAALHQMLVESFAAEHSSRMFAMKAASDNATELLDDLSLSYNYARQDGITRELSEIVGGAAALQVR